MGLSRVERHGEVERVQMTLAIAGRPVYWTSAYRVGSVLVDSGCSTARDVFVRWLRGAQVSDVLTTHEHEDHIGNHAALPPEVVVHAPPIARSFLEAGHPRFPLYRRLVWGYHEPRPPTQGIGERVEAGGRRFRVVQTPGHSADHVAYLDEATNALFSGDAYMGRFKAARLEEDVHTEIASLRRMAEVDPSVMYPAHGPVIERPRARLLDTADHFADLAKRCHKLAERGLSRKRIAREVLGREPFLSYYSMGEFSTLKMVENLLRAAP